MNILQVTHRFYSKSGGGSYVVYNLSKALKKKGHEVTIISSDYNFEYSYVNQLKEYGVEIIPFKFNWNFGQFYFTKHMEEWLLNNIDSFDLIHLNGVRNYQNLMVLKIAKKYNIPIVMQSHGSIEIIGNHKLAKRLFDIFYKKKIIDDVSQFISLNESEKQAHQRIGIAEDKIEVVPNGINLNDFRDLPNKGQFKKLYNIPNKKKIILYVGRIDRTKGLDLLISSFKKLIKKRNDVLLVFVGSDTGFKQTLLNKIHEEKLEKHIIFTDFLSEEQKISAFVDSSIFVTPRFYGFPITFIESFACGLPIITTTGGDSLDWVNGKVGYCTDYDEFDFSRAMEKLIENEELNLEFSKNCKKMVRNTLNWESISDQIVDIYNKVQGL